VAFIYFWTFNVFAKFVLLNFLVAVISAGFQDESTKSRSFPLDYLLKRAVRSFEEKMSIFKSWKNFKTAVINRSRRLPASIILDYLRVFHRDELQKKGITLDMIENDILAEPEILISRADLTNGVVMPKSEYSLIASETFDDIWEDLVVEYEIGTKEKEEEDKERTAKQRRAVIRCLHELPSQSSQSLNDAASDAEVINETSLTKVFTKPKAGLAGLQDRTALLEEQMKAAGAILTLIANKAGSLEWTEK